MPFSDRGQIIIQCNVLFTAVSTSLCKISIFLILLVLFHTIISYLCKQWIHVCTNRNDGSVKVSAYTKRANCHMNRNQVFGRNTTVTTSLKTMEIARNGVQKYIRKVGLDRIHRKSCFTVASSRLSEAIERKLCNYKSAYEVCK